MDFWTDDRFFCHSQTSPELLDLKGMIAEFVKHRHNQVPMKKMGDAFDVANAVLFLASDEAKYITGTEIIVDGGLTSVTP